VPLAPTADSPTAVTGTSRIVPLRRWWNLARFPGDGWKVCSDSLSRRNNWQRRGENGDDPGWKRSARGPAHCSSAYQVKVNVKYGLPGCLVAIHDYPVAIISDALAAGDPRCYFEQLPDSLGIIG
jgi:hypothetical protein